MAGAPSKFNKDITQQILDFVTDGGNIKNACAESGISFQTWCNWKADNSELFDLYVKARQDKAEGLESEIDRYMSLLEKKTIEPSAANVLIQTLKWKLSKFYPKMFGDKVDVTTDGEKINSAPSDIVVKIITPTDS
jgi:hypothetical protein